MPLDAIHESPFNGTLMVDPDGPKLPDTILKELSDHGVPLQHAPMPQYITPPAVQSPAAFMASLTQEGLTEALKKAEAEVASLRVLLEAVKARDNASN